MNTVGRSTTCSCKGPVFVWFLLHDYCQDQYGSSVWIETYVAHTVPTFALALAKVTILETYRLMT